MPSPAPSPIVLSVPTQPRPRDASELYLDLMKKILTRALTAKEMERHTIGSQGPKGRLMQRINKVAARFGLELVRLTPTAAQNYLESGHEVAHRAEDAETMLGTRQLDHMQQCIADVLARNIPGDLIEAGVWRGGMTIFMRAVLAAYQDQNRKVWVADSFAGLPAMNSQNETLDWRSGEMAVSLETVKTNFAKYNLLDEQVIFLKGFFADTFPAAPIRQLSILRVDADLYQSTADVLRTLYAKLSPGGYAIFDDYENLPDCRRAIDEFRRDHRLTEQICPIDDRAVFWTKQA